MAYKLLIILSLFLSERSVIQASDLDNETLHTVKKRRVDAPLGDIGNLSMKQLVSMAYMADMFGQVRPQDRCPERQRYVVKRGLRKRYLDRKGPEIPVKNDKGEPLNFFSPMLLIIKKEIAYALIMNDPSSFLKLTRASKAFATLRTDQNILNFTLDYLGDLTGNPEHFNTIYRGGMKGYPLHNLMHILANKRTIQGFFAPSSTYWTTHLRIGNNKLYIPGPPYGFLPPSWQSIHFVPTHLPNFNSLEELNISNKFLVALPPLANLTALTSLTLGKNHIPNVSLDTLTQLRTLSLCGQKCPSIPKLTNLQRLSLTDPSRQHCDELTRLSSLTYLYLNQCRISTLPDLSGNQNLTNLDICELGLTALEGLDHLVNLESLAAHKNRLSIIANLHRLTALRQLRLERNQLTSIAGVEELQNLSDLFVGHNRLEHLPRSWNTPLLSQIQVQGNQLDEISGLEGIPKLRILYIAGNKPLVQLQGFEHLTRIDRVLISRDQTPTKKYLLNQNSQNGTRTAKNLNYMIQIIDPNQNF